MNSKEIIDKEFTLDLGSTPVQVVVKNITKDKVIVEYLNSTPGRMEEFTISDFEYFAMIKIDNNKDLIEDAYVNYCKHFVGYDDIPKIDWFIQEIKNNTEFAERWGLKIEERELSLEERTKYKKKRDGIVRTFASYTHQMLDNSNVPTKLITITYNKETIESYE
jgi:hypothetical protein